MKKTGIGFFIILTLFFASCNSAVREEYGTVVIDLDGSASLERALNAQALPEFYSAYIYIKITGSTGTFVKTLEPGAFKNLSVRLPVGDRVHITVFLSNESGIWSGSTEHTVRAGANAAAVKLNKSVSGLNTLPFTLFEDSSSGSTRKRLTFYFNGKPVSIPEVTGEYAFARDSKGRLYVSYQSGDGYITRYTSEGNPDGEPRIMNVSFFANDYAQGKMYAAVDDGSLKELADAPDGGFKMEDVISAYSRGSHFAVDSGRLVVCEDWNDGAFVLSNIGSDKKNQKEVMATLGKLGVDQEKGWELNDLFIRGGYLFLLLSKSKKAADAAVYSQGAVLKWRLGVTVSGGVSLPDLIGEPEVIGKGNSVDRGYIASDYYAAHFYGAVKVIGFSSDVIMIADDGFDGGKINEKLCIVKNRNRIAVLDIHTNKLTFTEADPAVQWLKEEEIE